jgi:hypothetical protein
VQNGWIDGQIWKDKNANGSKDADEEWYSGVTVSLGKGECSSSGYMTRTSDGSGTFTFNNLPPGKYCVRIDIPQSCGSYCIPKTTTQKTIVVSPGTGSDAGLFGFAPYIC